MTYVKNPRQLGEASVNVSIPTWLWLAAALGGAAYWKYGRKKRG